MKKNLLFAVLLVLGATAWAQPWHKNLPANKAQQNLTLFDYQKAFNDYWQPYNVVGGWYTDAKGEQVKASGWKRFKRAEWFWKYRVDNVTGEFPTVTAEQQFEKWQRLNPNKATSIQGNWSSIGPSNTDVAGRGTGRVNCITFHPTDANTFWVGAPAGGVWKTTNGGTSWTVLTDNNEVLGVSDICLAQDFTTSNTIYIATGDRDGGSLWGLNGGQAHDNEGVGILKSTDGGATWQTTGLVNEVKEQVVVARIIAHPSNNTTLWAATNKGLYKTTDAGATWSLKQGGSFISMHMKPSDPTTFYASTSVYGAPYPAIYRSTDGGDTWTNVQQFTIDEYRVELAVTPANSAVVYAVVSTTDYNGTSGGYGALKAIYKSTNSGATFTQVFNGTTRGGTQANPTGNNLFGWRTNCGDDGGQGDYDNAVAVSPTDANRIYVAGVNGHMSTNGATGFTPVSCWTSSTYYNQESPLVAVVHADHHMAKYNPLNGYLYDCNDGGVYYSTNNGTSWVDITPGLVNGQLYGIGVAQSVSGEVVGGFQDNGTKLLRTGGSNWYDVKGGDGMHCAIDYTTEQNQYGTYANGQIDKTIDNWGVASSIRSNTSPADADWAAPLEINPIISGSVFPTGGNDDLFFGDATVDVYNGTGWTTLSQTISTSFLTSLDVYNNGSKIVIYAADVDKIWKSPDITTYSAKTFVDVTGNLPTNAITDIEIKYNDPLTVWVTLGGYDGNRIYKTTNGGTSWTNISEGLPELPAMSVIQNKRNTTQEEIYIGTDIGVYVKLGNAPWVLFSGSLPNVVVTDLEFYYGATSADDKLYASTFSRGVWVSDPYAPATLDAAIASVSVPTSEYCATQNITPTVSLSNIGTTTLTSATVSYSIDGGTAVNYNWTGSLAQGVSTNVTFPTISLSYGTHSFVASVSAPNGGSDGNSVNNSYTQEYSVWNNTLPYTQNFDNFTVSIGYPDDAVDLQECWTNVSGETATVFDWSVNNFATGSATTGPDFDHTSGNGKYVYTECSGILEATTVQLLSPTFDLTNYATSQLTFWYHMYGANIGSLRVDLYYNGSWHTGTNVSWNGTLATSVSGDKGNTWLQATADVSAACGFSDAQIRFHSVSGTSTYGDIAIDDFSLTGTFACTSPSTQASNFAATPGYSNINLTWTRGNGNNVLVVAKQGSAVSQDPSINTAYTANASFGSGDEIGVGNYVVYKGSGTGVNVTGLLEGTAYHFAVYEYNNTSSCYNLTQLTGNATTQIHAPDVTASSPDNFFADKGASLTISGNYIYAATFTLGGVSGAVTSNDGSTAVVSFPAGSYSNNTLTVTTNGGSDTYTVTVNTRNTIPVGGGTDYHATITSALDGLSAWKGATAFTNNMTIDVYAGTYTEKVTPATTLNTSSYRLIIQAHDGQSPVIDASSKTNGIYVGNLSNVTISGFTVHSATSDNILVEGDNAIVKYIKTYNSSGASGIKLNGSDNSSVTNCLSYNNYNYGIHALTSNNTTVKNNTLYSNGHTYSPATNVLLFSQDWEDGTMTNWVSTASGWTNVSSATYAHGGTRVAYATSTTNDTLKYTPTISVSGYTNIILSCWVRSTTTQAGNYVRGFYRIDGGAWTQFFSLTAANTTYTQYSTSTITGSPSTIEIRFPASIGSGSRYWFVDDITIYGDENIVPEQGAGLYVESGTGTVVTNNIMTAKSGTSFYAMQTATGVSISNSSGYNTYFANGNTNFIKHNGTSYSNLTTWNGTTQGNNDLNGDPKFVTAGTDFHLQSTSGAYNGGTWPPTTLAGGTWTNSAATSPSIDAGNPSDTYFDEPWGNGTRINQGAYGGTVQASKTNNSTTTTWAGGAVGNETSWATAANWSGGVPNSTANVVIANVANNPLVTGTVSCNNLTISAGGLLDVQSGGSLTVNGNLLLESSASAMSGLLDNGTLTINGTTTVNLHLATASRYYYVSSPVNAATAQTFGTTAELSGSNNTDRKLYHYDGTGWQRITNQNTTLENAKGYAFKTPTTVPFTASFVGTLNTATQNASLYAGGYTLIGNPYPSALDWGLDADAAGWSVSTTWDISAVNTSIWYRQGGDGTTGGTFFTYNRMGGTSINGTLGSRYIPAMQSFWIENAGSAATLTMTNAARELNDAPVLKHNPTSNGILVTISNNQGSDQTLLAFNDGATNDYDLYDSRKKLADGNVPQIYTEQGALKLAINTMATTDKTVSLPVVVNVAQAGTYSLSLSYFGDFDRSVQVFIEDKLTNTFADISNAYNFATDVTGDLKNRFVLHLVQSATGVANNNALTDYVYTFDKNIYINRNSDKQANVTIFDVVGNQLYTKQVQGNGLTTVSMHQAGCYFVKITKPQGSQTFKVVVQ